MTDTPDHQESRSDDATDSDAAGSGARYRVDDERTAETDWITRSELERWLRLGAIGVLVLLGGLAAFQAYFTASEAISLWISDAYEPVFATLFNVAVLGLSVLGVTVLIRGVE